MSSGRRAGNDQSILEMLERDTGRSHRRGNRSRRRWYVAGGALAAGMIGLLAWLSRDPPPAQEAQPIVVAEVAPTSDRAKPDPAADLYGLSDLDDPPRPHHAAVVDERLAKQAKAITPVAMLNPEPLPATQATAGAVVQDDPAPAGPSKRVAPPASESSPSIVRKQSTNVRRSPAPPAASKNLGTAKAEPVKKQTRLGNDATHRRAQAKPAAAASDAHGSARKPAQNPPAARKPSASKPPARHAVDSDVALISAVIQHSSAKAEDNCLDASCAAKTTAHP